MMRDLPFKSPSAGSSSSFQQRLGLKTPGGKNKASTSSPLTDEIANLQSRLKHMDEDSPMTVRQPPPALDASSSHHAGYREPPQGSESSLLVNQLRKDLAKVEHDRAEMEVTLMNQMIQNQTAMDELRTKLAQRERELEERTQQQSSSLDTDRLKTSLDEERALRQALEEERDARSKELLRVKEQRDACESESFTQRREVQLLKQQVKELHSNNEGLSEQAKMLASDKTNSDKLVESLRSQVRQLEQGQKFQHSDVEIRLQKKLEKMEQQHKAAIAEMGRAEQTRLSEAESTHMEELAKMNHAGQDHLQSQVTALQEEKKNLSSKCSSLQRSLGEERKSTSKLNAALDAKQAQCSKLEQKLLKHQTDDNSDALMNQINQLTDQLTQEQAKAARYKAASKQSSSGSPCAIPRPFLAGNDHQYDRRTSTGGDRALSTEMEILRKQNGMLTEELKKAKGSGEIEFLRQQNKLLGERSNNLRAEQLEELERLRRQNKSMSEELKATRTESNQELLEELEALQMHNNLLGSELKSLKHKDDDSHSVVRRSPAPKHNVVHSPSRLPRCTSPRPFPSSTRRGRAEATNSNGLKTPPLSPSVASRTRSSSVGPARTPVRGLVESFERRMSFAEIRRINSECSMHVDTEMVDSAGDEHEADKATIRDLEESLRKEVDKVAFLQSELSAMEEHNGERQRLAGKARESEEEIQRLRAKINEQERTILDLKERLCNESKLVASLQSEASTSSGRANECAKFEDQVRRSDEEILKLRGKIGALQEDYSAQIKEMKVKLNAKEEALSEVQLKFEVESEVVTELQDRLNVESEVVAMLRNDLAEMEKKDEDRSKLEKNCRESDEELQKLRLQVSDLEMALAKSQGLLDEAQVDSVRADLAKAETSRQDLEKKVGEDEAAIQRLQSDIHHARLQDEEREKEVEKLTSSLSESEKSRQEVEAKRKEDEALIERLQAELGAARMGLEKSLDDMERVKSTGVVVGDSSLLHEREQTIQRQYQEMQNLRSELAVAKQALDINALDIDKMDKFVKDASRKNSVEQTLNNQQKQEVDRLRSQVEALQTELSEALKHVEELKTAMATIKEAHDSELKDAQIYETRASKTLDAEVSTLKLELTKNQMAKADMEMAHMSKVHDLEAYVDTVQADMEVKLDSKTKQVNELQLSLKRKEDEIRQMQQEREQICSSMNNISSSRKGEMDELQQEVMTLTSKTTSQAREMQALQMKIEEHEMRNSEMEKLRERISELEEECRRTPKVRSSKQNDSAQVDDAILREENVMLRNSLRDISLERRGLQDKLEALIAEKSSSKSTQVLRERNAALKKEVEKLTKRLKKMEHNMTRFTI